MSLAYYRKVWECGGMMEIQIQQGKIWTTEPHGNAMASMRRVAMCEQHMGDTLADYLMDPEALADLERRRAEHNATYHPRRWRRHLRREEILAELQVHLKDNRAIELAYTRTPDAWATALPLLPAVQEHLNRMGGPVATEEYRREFPERAE